MLSKIFSFFKRESVLCVSGMLALASCFLVPPSAKYAEYINLRVLALLFCLMAAVAGIKKAGAFDILCARLLSVNKSEKRLAFTLTFFCFFASMFLTNDVTLITAVPFTLLVFKNLGDTPKSTSNLINVLVLETAAANLGSMLTPLGNPQNLYLYARYSIALKDFILLMLPYTVISLVILLAMSLIFVRDTKSVSRKLSSSTGKKLLKKDFAFHTGLFLLCILSVARLIDWKILFFAVLLLTLIFDRSVLKKIDYFLLLTFCFFFIFTGNLGKIPVFSELLAKILKGRELLISIISSQFISNVPAALLLSSFTEEGEKLVVGTNLGGLGTLIASMASLITYKFYAAEKKANSKRYLAVFTAANVFLLLVLYFFYIFASRLQGQ